LKKGELQVTVIATNFPADMPKKNLFSNTPITIGQTLVKDESPATIKKEINNTIKNGTISGPTIPSTSSINNNDFIKKMDTKKPEPIEDIIVDDDGDDWSAVPAFLRRKK
jgi:hypothetical protein